MEGCLGELSHPGLSRRGALAGIGGVAILAGVVSGASTARSREGNKMIYVLVHPAWLGGWCWNKIAPLLRAAGHDVYAPTLTGLGERAHLSGPNISLATHIEDVVSVLEFENLQRVILVGNSSGGMVITGVADRVPERLAGVVYLDAFVPEDNQSLVDLLPADRRKAMEEFVKAEGQGWLLPRFAPLPWERIVREMWGVTSNDDVRWMLARLRPTPFRHFTDPVRRINPTAAKIGHVFIRCQQFQPGKHVFDRHGAMAQQTSGWRYLELGTPHLPYITHPAELAKVLLDLAA
jgi:pimeloyl-ACP methyl ester carboxylesterase